MGRALVLAALGAALVHVLLGIDRGWIPHDDGLLAHAAGRVLDGELPHRDFDDMYSGGQAMLHAVAFAVLGERLLTLRVVLWGTLALTVPALYGISRRWASRPAATFVTLLAVAWTVPVYPAAMPSWYNLFLAVWALWALLRHVEDGRARWLALAGACAGVSITVKVVGLYLVGAGLLHAVFLEQESGLAHASGPSASAARPGPPGPPVASGGYGLLVAGGTLAFLAALAGLVGFPPDAGRALHFLLPPGVLVAVLLAREWRGRPVRPPGKRFRTLLSLVLPFLGGVAVPVAVFLAPYVASGAVGDLFRGMFVLPSLRLEEMVRLPPSPVAALPLFVLAGLLVLARRRKGFDPWLAAALALALGTLLVMAGRPAWYRVAWALHVPVIPAVVLVGAGRLLAGGEEEVAPAALFAALATVTMVGLVQFPTHIPFYLFYAAPLAVLAALAVAAPLRRAPRRSLAVVATFFLLFAVRWIHPGFVYQLGDRFEAHPPTERLGLEAGGIRVVPGERERYERLVALLDRVGGEHVWATPDAPEVYFLSGRNNPTRTFFDRFDDREGRTERVLGALSRHGVRTVVVNRSPVAVSELPSGPLLDSLVTRYPRAYEIGSFVVLTADDPGG